KVGTRRGLVANLAGPTRKSPLDTSPWHRPTIGAGPAPQDSARPSFAVLREDQDRIRRDRDQAPAGQAIAFARPGRDVAGLAALELPAVAAPVAVEPDLPRPLGGESDRVIVLWL